MGVPRKEIPWAPNVDYSKCDLCGGDPQCFKFCPHNVYGVRAEPKKLMVENPDNCVVFCRSCARVCSPAALSFPNKPEVLKLIREKRGF